MHKEIVALAFPANIVNLSPTETMLTPEYDSPEMLLQLCH
jgi:hypothetical protein